MKRFFVAYRFSGETTEVLEQRLRATVDALQQAGIDGYCNYFDQHDIDKKNLTPRQVMEKAFQQIDEMDGLFVLIASNDKSEGQLIEVGYTFAKGKPIIAAVQKDAKTYVDSLADHTIRWENIPDLQEKLKGL